MNKLFPVLCILILLSSCAMMPNQRRPTIAEGVHIESGIFFYPSFLWGSWSIGNNLIIRYGFSQNFEINLSLLSFVNTVKFSTIFQDPYKSQLELYPQIEFKFKTKKTILT